MLQSEPSPTASWPEAPPGPPASPRIRALLLRALDLLRHPAALERSEPLPLDALDAVDRQHLADALPAGELAVTVRGSTTVHARDTVFAGLWWVLPDLTRPERCVLEVGLLPQAVREAARDAERLAPHRDARCGPLTEAPALSPLLADVAQRQRRWRPGQPPRVINLSHAALDASARQALDALLGPGTLRATAHAATVCEVRDTAWSRVWRVRHRDVQGRCVLDLLEIGPLPACVQPGEADLESSAFALQEGLAR